MHETTYCFGRAVDEEKRGKMAKLLLSWGFDKVIITWWPSHNEMKSEVFMSN